MAKMGTAITDIDVTLTENFCKIVKLSFMNDFSKEAASNLLVQIGKKRGLQKESS